MDIDAWRARVSEVWGDRWDLSLAYPSTTRDKVTVICRDHGEFVQPANSLVSGILGCPECPGSNARWTQDTFIRAVNRRWDHRWDLSKVTFTSTKGNVTVLCREHGEFLHRAEYLLAGKIGCSKCASNTRLTQEEYQSRVLSVWGDRWDLSEVVYESSSSKVKLICRDHGEFYQTPSNTFAGKIGCNKCLRDSVVSNEEYLRKLYNVWGDRWDTSRVVYTGTHNKVILGCREHGWFDMIAYTSLLGVIGCFQCNGNSGKRSEDSLKYDAKQVWGDRWDWTQFRRVSTLEVVVGCYEHGLFRQNYSNMLRGHIGCVECQKSKTSMKEEELFQYVQRLVEGEAERRKVGLFDSPRMEVDIYIPSRKIAIEFNGLYYHSTRFSTSPYKNSRKIGPLREKGIRLLTVWEDDWDNRRSLVEKTIAHIIGVSTEDVIYARDTKVVYMSKDQATKFMDSHHMQGFAQGTITIGLSVNDIIVAAASFRKQKEDYLLARYATSSRVVGGHSKLVSWFENNYVYSSLITFADLSMSDGNLYRTTGWEEDAYLDPDYSYVVRVGSTRSVREHKINYRKKRFKEDPSLKYEEGLTETQLAALNGLYRIYDCGKIRFVKPHPDDTTETLPESRTDG